MTHVPSTDRRDDAALPQNVIAYLRSAGPESDALANQARVLEEVIFRAGHVPSGTRLVHYHAPEKRVFVDSGVSSLSSLDERAGSAGLLDWCETHPRDAIADPGFIYVSSISRLGPFLEGAEAVLYWQERLRRAGWLICSVAESGISSFGRGEIYKALRKALERDMAWWRSAGVRRGMQFVKDLGFWQGGRAPHGYSRCVAQFDDATGSVEILEELAPGRRSPYSDSVRFRGETRTFTTLVPNESAEWVRRIYEWYADGIDGELESMSGIARRLNRLAHDADAAPGAAAAPGGGTWSGRRIAGVLSNAVYAGRQPGKDVGNGRWEAIVDADLWQRANDRRARRRGS